MGYSFPRIAFLNISSFWTFLSSCSICSASLVSDNEIPKNSATTFFIPSGFLIFACEFFITSITSEYSLSNSSADAFSYRYLSFSFSTPGIFFSFASFLRLTKYSVIVATL